MRTKHPNILHCSLVGAAIATLCALPATAQDTVKLKFADWLPPTHYTSAEGAVVLIEKAKELAGDSLQIDYFPAEQLGKGADMLRLGQSGIAEIVNIAPAYITEKFPLSGVAELPNIYQQSCDGSLAFDELATGDGILAESEWKPNGMKVLFVGGLGAYRLLTAEKQVNTAADIEGLKLRTAGGAMDMTAAAMKANSVRMPGPDVLPSLSRGTIDGVFFPLQSVRPWGLQDALNHMTPDLGVGSFTIIYAISDKSWNKLSPEMQNALSEAGAYATRHHCEFVQREEEKITALLQAENGIVPTALPQADLETLEGLLSGVQNEWAKSLDDRGLPGTQVLNDFKAALAD